ncbi:MAG: VanZ family protein, partial [Gammaproteobacteria bacterium]|nr:VanZ family protein [Gammaproteobacteria bacterium]
FFTLNYRFDEQTVLWTEIQNTGHSIIFILLSFLLAQCFRLWGVAGVGRQVLYALLLCIFLSLVTEFAQQFTQRDGNIYDFIRDIAGTAIGLCIYFLIQSSTLHSRWFAHTIMFSLIVLMLSAALWPLSINAWHTWQRNQSFPVLFDFEKGWHETYIDVNNAKLEIRTEEASDIPFAFVEIGEGAYPGLRFHEPFEDWRGFAFLRLEIESLETEPFDMTIRIHDDLHNNEFDDRFNQKLFVVSGMNSYKISLNRVHLGPAGRTMNMSEIKNVNLFTVRPSKPIRFKLHKFELQ